MQAVAVRITRENLGLIASEAGLKFTREEIDTWFEKHDSGYFLRDDTSTFDCHLMVDSVFFTMYEFKYPHDDTALLRPIVKI